MSHGRLGATHPALRHTTTSQAYCYCYPPSFPPVAVEDTVLGRDGMPLRYPVSKDTMVQGVRRDQFLSDGSDADGVILLTSSGRHRQLAGTLPHVFLRRTQTTRTPHCPSTCRHLNGQQRSPWCPTPGAPAQNRHPVCGLILVGGGGNGSEAPWRPWDDGGRHGRWVHGLASFS